MRGKKVKVGESRTLARERGGSEREHGEKRVDSTVKEARLQGRQARRASLGEVEGSVSGRKSSRKFCRVLVSLLVWPERRLGDEEPAHKMKE